MIMFIKIQTYLYLICILLQVMSASSKSLDSVSIDNGFYDAFDSSTNGTNLFLNAVSQNYRRLKPSIEITYIFVFPGITFTDPFTIIPDTSPSDYLPQSHSTPSYTSVVYTYPASWSTTLSDNNIILPSWILCIILKPTPLYCNLLTRIDGTPNHRSTTCVTLVHSYPGIPPFFFPNPPYDCYADVPRSTILPPLQDDEKKEMLLHILCILIRPIPNWCPDLFHDTTNIILSTLKPKTTDECKEVTDIIIPKWVLCFVFKPTPPFCKKYQEYSHMTEEMTTCATVMYSGIPPFPPAWPCPPIRRPSKENLVSGEKTLPWWILCAVMKPAAEWCPDIFKCNLTPATEATRIDHTEEFPWWKLCENMHPPPKECKHITPIRGNVEFQSSNHDSYWWLCLIIKPTPQWCEKVTIPQTEINEEKSVDFTYTQYTSDDKHILGLDTQYPLWWMCIYIKPPPYFCEHVTFPTDVTKHDYPNSIKDINLFMFCWWWLCELLKPWATWCQNLPSPPPGLLNKFLDKIPSEILVDLPVKSWIIEFP